MRRSRCDVFSAIDAAYQAAAATAEEEELERQLFEPPQALTQEEVLLTFKLALERADAVEAAGRKADAEVRLRALHTRYKMEEERRAQICSAAGLEYLPWYPPLVPARSYHIGAAGLARAPAPMSAAGVEQPRGRRKRRGSGDGADASRNQRSAR
jgi:hypothetical protein